MTLPLLNRKLVLETAVRTPDRAGGYGIAWRPLGTLWAEIKAGSGTARGANGLELSRVPLRITVRAAPVGSEARPAAGQRFREGARVYAILAVTERDTLARFLTCHAEEEVVA
ncbi:head-tail adaptor protein [Loktanella sp. M215]|uniref:head-tail adaptor protein n=1 Tax=Loktanella sp. M215 TaxID=2675431 RepID=UPI001F2F73C9|nr:head-tail adaptor protein [Loktanella sp. M215]MCF7700328.1 head-tail adaptor protein [Loktanella sp. M215]